MMFSHLGIAVRLNSELFIIIRATATLCMFYSFQPYEPFKPYEILGTTTNHFRDFIPSSFLVNKHPNMIPVIVKHPES